MLAVCDRFTSTRVPLKPELLSGIFDALKKRKGGMDREEKRRKSQGLKSAKEKTKDSNQPPNYRAACFLIFSLLLFLFLFFFNPLFSYLILSPVVCLAGKLYVSRGPRAHFTKGRKTDQSFLFFLFFLLVLYSFYLFLFFFCFICLCTTLSSDGYVKGLLNYSKRNSANTYEDDNNPFVTPNTGVADINRRDN